MRVLLMTKVTDGKPSHLVFVIFHPSLYLHGSSACVEVVTVPTRLCIDSRKDTTTRYRKFEGKFFFGGGGEMTRQQR